MGPTASGKTDLAVRLAQSHPFELISVDSALVYRGMDIGTAKPDAATLAATPHRLIDICDPAEAYSAARFRDDALAAMAAAVERGRIPLLVGGTMLYFRALTSGLSPLPAADEAVRQALEREQAEHGLAAMHARLASVDPVAAARIHPNDPQRIHRALEVYALSGSSLSEMYRQQARSGLPYAVHTLVVAPSTRQLLHERIALRFRQMLAAGFIEEVEGLYRRGDLSLDLPSMRAVGYRQAWQYLAGDYDHTTMVEKAVVATRQLAKRQFTWLRSEPGAHWLDSLEPDLFRQAVDHLGRQGVL